MARHSSILRRGADAVGRGGVFYVAPWVVVACSDLFLKSRLLKWSGFEKAATAIGHQPEYFSFFDKLAFFRADLLIVGLIAPLLLVASAVLLPRRWRLLWVAGLAVVAELILFLQYETIMMIGRYAEFGVLWTGLKWWYENPESATGGTVLRAAGGIGVSVMAILGLSIWAHRWARHQAESRTANAFRRASWAAGLLLVSLTLAAWIPRVHQDVFHRDLLSTATLALVTDHTENIDPAIFKLDIQDGMTLYRKLVRAPQDTRSPAYFGRLRNYNVVFFVLETTPTRVVDPAVDDLHDLPNLKRLRETSFVPTRHYTTFPDTSWALSSMFTSMYTTYPFGHSRDVMVPGLMHSLADEGYQTGFYGFIWERERDDVMLKDLGFRRLVNSPVIRPDFFTAVEAKLPMSVRINRDYGPLQAMEADIRKFAAQRQKFAAVFAPEFGHGPWPPIEGHPNATVDERGRALVEYQDTWLGELFAVLEQSGTLNNTIIVFTADHGIRLPMEDPSLPLGKIDDVSFHVPLLISVPGLLDKPVSIQWPTSHIDLQPTVLDLLGIVKGREDEEGSPIWEAGLAHRMILMLADPVFGADGYYDDGRYYMEQYSTETLYASDVMHFDDRDILSPESAKPVRDTLRKLTSVEKTITFHIQGPGRY